MAGLSTMKRFGQREDRAATILFLLSDGVAWGSEQVSYVNGGLRPDQGVNDGDFR